MIYFQMNCFLKCLCFNSISVDPNDQKKTACYDIDVEVDDPLKGQMNGFLLSTANQQEIASLDNKIHETIESINQLKIQRDFMLSFSRDPKGYIQDWICSQNRDLKLMTDPVGNSRGREKSRVLQPAMFSRSRQSLLLLQDSTAKTGA
ncbi:SWI/SNF-related matrix-associated actin-dependent regulator of chromatin subfamily D member 3 [Danio aesculapii]|uniref:SWI/SNF-related matrix-associated actin-dependent regulator of chromatin subfamily D member 3 n=1 Tax=Danio aesculapii TaxID=1142201 RepID=UPI0024C05E38|nr:SWI/SNF-related matrix-associated actin-dependent regulator of chromatin subfamily D member 3 [Danio aesculapii]